MVTLTPLSPAAAGASPTMQPHRRRLAALAVPIALAGVLVLTGPAQAQRDPSTPTWDETYQAWLTEFIASVIAATQHEIAQAQEAIEDAQATIQHVDEVLGGSSTTEAEEGGTREPAGEDAGEEAGEEEVSALLDQGAWPKPAATPEVVPEPVGKPVDEPEDGWPRVETPTLAGGNAFDIGIGLGPSVLVTTAEPQELSGITNITNITDIFDQPPADTTRTGGGVVDGRDGGLLGEFGQLSQPVDADPVLGGLDTEVLDPRDVQYLPSAPDLPAQHVPAPGGRDDLLG